MGGGLSALGPTALCPGTSALGWDLLLPTLTGTCMQACVHPDVHRSTGHRGLLLPTPTGICMQTCVYICVHEHGSHISIHAQAQTIYMGIVPL